MAHAGRDRAAAEPRNHRGAEAGADQRQLRGVFRRRVRDARLVAAAAQRVQQPVVADRSFEPGDPRLGGQVVELHGARLGQAMAGRQRDVGDVVHQRGLGRARRAAPAARSPSPGRWPRSTSRLTSSGDAVHRFELAQHGGQLRMRLAQRRPAPPVPARACWSRTRRWSAGRSRCRERRRARPRRPRACRARARCARPAAAPNR